jgi:hypothetical protein
MSEISGVPGQAIQHALAKRVYFTVEADLSARASEAKVEPSDAGEE